MQEVQDTASILGHRHVGSWNQDGKVGLREATGLYYSQIVPYLSSGDQARMLKEKATTLLLCLSSLTSVLRYGQQKSLHSVRPSSSSLQQAAKPPSRGSGIHGICLLKPNAQSKDITSQDYTRECSSPDKITSLIPCIVRQQLCAVILIITCWTVSEEALCFRG